MNVNELILQRRIEPHLLRIAKVLPPEYALTLVARYKTSKYKDADIVLTDDELPAAAKALAKQAARNRHVWNDLVEVPWALLFQIVDCAALSLRAQQQERRDTGRPLAESVKPALATLRWAARLDWCLVATRMAMYGDGLSGGLDQRVKLALRMREKGKKSLEWA